MTPSIHYEMDRCEREAFICENIGLGTIVDEFIVDRGHPNGAEVHSVTDTAIILIHNQNTNQLITELIARPNQLKKLYGQEGRLPPKKILKLAYMHNAKRFNEK